MTKIVTRFAPSPTGFLHIGGARTAIFSWLLARQSGGEFRLRIEDTDRERSTQEMTDAILESLYWLGLTWDGEPIYQSERFDLYNAHIDTLLETGHAYWCECTPEEVEAMREEARAKGQKPKYNGRCRERGLGPGEGRVVRLKGPLDGRTVYDDLVKGAMGVDNAEMDDMILRRSDGSPTYNLAVVVDDHEMGVTHVIRGDDHVNNTFRQIQLYRAFGFDLPAFGHVPLIHGQDKKKLSKRHGARSVTEYHKDGLLPEALVNYLVRLGWSSGDQEIFSLEELISLFTTTGLSKSPAAFDPEKLLWLNSHYIKECSHARLAGLLAEQLYFKDVLDLDPLYLETIVPLYQPRAKTLAEMADMCTFFIIDDLALDYAEKDVATFLDAGGKELLAAARDALAGVAPFTKEAMEPVFHALLEERGIKFKVLAAPIRVALAGCNVSPGLFETMEVLGKERVMARIERGLAL
ncbi:MAG: glutamate--tRNA ligase [Desulfovibrionaceae bacterium]